MTTSQSRLILLAEDDEDDQQFILQAFKRLNSDHQVYITQNGQEVLNYLAEKPSDKLPCLIVLDLNMPILDGAQTLDMLRQNPAYERIPKVIFTTSTLEKDKEKCLQKGAADYMVKPGTLPEIVQSLSVMLQYCA